MVGGLMDILKDMGIGVGMGGVIKSIQRGVANWSNTNFTNDISISAIEANNSIINVYLAPASINTVIEAREITTSGIILDNETIRLERERNTNVSSSTYQIYWEVIEFERVKSKQEGTQTTATSAQFTITISSVDITKSTIYFNARSAGREVGHSGAGPYVHAMQLTNSTTITCRPAAGDKTINWQDIEFE